MPARGGKKNSLLQGRTSKHKERIAARDSVTKSFVARAEQQTVLHAGRQKNKCTGHNEKECHTKMQHEKNCCAEQHDNERIVARGVEAKST